MGSLELGLAEKIHTNYRPKNMRVAFFHAMGFPATL